MPTTETLIRVYQDGASRGRCRSCEADLVWMDTLRGKKMPMNAGAVPRKSETDPDTRRVVLFFAAEDSHFSSCPDAAKFSRKAR